MLGKLLRVCLSAGCCALMCAVMPTCFCFSQETLHLTVQDAERIFLDKNLLLLAEKYNVDAAKAQIIQAKVYNNPAVSFSGNIYNPQLKRPFDLSEKTGQYTIGIEQVIWLAGQRNRQIKLAETNAQIAEYRFYDLLRTLKYSLRSVFYNIHYLRNSVAAYQLQVASLDSLNRMYGELYNKGIVSNRETARIRLLLYNLQTEQNNLQNQINDWQAQMQILLRSPGTLFITELSSIDSLPVMPRIQLQILIDTALSSRYDLKTAEAIVQYSELNLKLQRSLAVPNLSVGAEFDKRGSFVDNASFMNLGIDLPFFNRNRGNIKTAAIGIQQSKVQYEQARQTIEAEVGNTYLKATGTASMLQSFDPLFNIQMQQLLRYMLDNFQRRNISLLELTDFYESYSSHILKLNQSRNDLAQALEELNYVTGAILFNQ